MDIIIKNIYNDIIELSDLCLQKKLWLNKNNNTGQISSYVELMCRLFDDNNFDDFIDNKTHEMNFDKEVIYELKNLRTLLNNYSEKFTDAEIIKDPKWENISLQAKKIMIYRIFENSFLLFLQNNHSCI